MPDKSWKKRNLVKLIAGQKVLMLDKSSKIKNLVELIAGQKRLVSHPFANLYTVNTAVKSYKNLHTWYKNVQMQMFLRFYIGIIGLAFSNYSCMFLNPNIFFQF